MMKYICLVILCSLLSPVWAVSSKGSTVDTVTNPSQFNPNRLFKANTAKVSLVRVNEEDFKSDSGQITFSEYDLGTLNPVYLPIDYGGGDQSPEISFGGFFQGQSLGDEISCPAGAALSGCVVGQPSNPLQLDAQAPSTFIAGDSSNPTSPVLSGSPIFNGPIAILFDRDIAGVGLDGGYFDASFSIAIAAFDRQGQLLGSVKNSVTGIEFFGLVTSDGQNHIAGILFSIVGDEPAGFAIDNLRFALSGQVEVPPQSAQFGIENGFIRLNPIGGMLPNNIDCTVPQLHYGRMSFDEINGRLYICGQKGWLYFEGFQINGKKE